MNGPRIAYGLAMSRPYTHLFDVTIAIDGWSEPHLDLVTPVTRGEPPATGWVLSPVIASAAMALSSVSVVTNSLRLRGFRAES